jgi:hypothetical protein
MIKIAHESPISIFPQVQSWTDYDYALVHLFEENEEYLNLFKKALAGGREVILDNSIFELGSAFDMKEFAHWTTELKPTWYIIPDALEDSLETSMNSIQWNTHYRSKVPGKCIGVVQGRTFDEIVECYRFLDKQADVDMIAISFDYSYYETECPHNNKLISWMLGRVNLLHRMYREGYINVNKPHHLLGCALPQEGLYYCDLDFIYSMDTSNPIVHGILDIPYIQGQGLWTKESQKLFKMINYPKDHLDMGVIASNVEQFREFWNG